MIADLLLPAATAGAALLYAGQAWVAVRAGRSVAGPIDRARRGARPFNDAVRHIAGGRPPVPDHGALADRVAVLERIATDPARRLRDEIDGLP